MHRKTRLEARRWAVALSDNGLYLFWRMLKYRDQRLIRVEWRDPENPWKACLATACGRLDPECREYEGADLEDKDAPNPGTAWLAKLDPEDQYPFSRVVTEWDLGTLDIDRFAAVFAAELKRRRAKASERETPATPLFINSGSGVFV